MPKAWTADAERQLLLEVIAFTKVKLGKNDWPVIAAKLGDVWTVEAIRQKFKKLHRAATKADDDDGENADSDAAATPKTPKTPATGNKTPRKRKPVKQDPDEDDSDTPVGTTPKPKKTRTVRTPRSTAKGKAALSEEMVTEDDNAGVEDKNVKLEPMGASDSDQFETPDHAGSDEDPGF